MLIWYQPCFSFCDVGPDDRLGAGAGRPQRKPDGRGGDQKDHPTAIPSWRTKSDESMAVSRDPVEFHGRRSVAGRTGKLSLSSSQHKSETVMPQRLPRAKRMALVLAGTAAIVLGLVSCGGKRDGPRRAGLHCRPSAATRLSRACAHLSARSHAHLSLLLQSRPARRIQLLFRLRPLRAGRHREPGAAAKAILSAEYRVASGPLWRARVRAGGRSAAD